MIITLYILLFIFILVFFISYIKKSTGDHLLRPFPGYVIIATIFYIAGISVSPIKIENYTVLSIFMGVSFIALGSYIATRHNKVPHTESDRSQIRENLRDTFPLKYVSAIAFAGLSVTLYLWRDGGIPLLATNVDSARSIMLSNGYVATLATVLDVSAIACLAFCLSYKGFLKDKRFYVALLIITIFVFVAILSGSRTRLLKLIVPGFIIYHFIYKNISILQLFYISIFGFLFIGGLGYYRAYSLWGLNTYDGLGMSAEDASFHYLIFYYATFELYVSIWGLQQVLENIPLTTDLSYGILHLGPILTPLQFDIPNPGEFFKSTIGGQWSGFGLAATLFAPMYADLGFGGIAIASTIYGLILGSFYNKTQIISAKTPYSVILYAILNFFFLIGLRSNLVSFEIIWFMFVSYSIFIFRGRKY